MTKRDILRTLHEIADLRMSGAGTWPADRESAIGYSKMLEELGLETEALGVSGDKQYTPLGLELNIELLTVFAGCWCISDIPGILSDYGLLADNEEKAIWARSSEAEVERLIYCYVRRAYLKFRNCSRFLN